MSFHWNVERARFNMIEQQIRPWEVLDPAVLALLTIVRREDFVPEAYRSLAFMDTEIPLPVLEGAATQESMLAPKVEARLLQELMLAPHESVLEIGAGSGFMAALLAHRTRHVLTLEIRPDLARFASANLKRAGIQNVTVRELDGSGGLPGEAPFDAIVLSGSVASLPSTLLAGLKIGGRLTAIVGEQPVMRAVRVTRTGEHGFSSVDLFDTVAPRLHGFDEPSRFHF
ncbi:MAG: protein-L-isoaspartate O-methyltransferase [Rhizobacter sp.]|nr:protein-L-isoaspartate O-methyltransferase [Burkholderiaceae bacterium]MCO5125363.1 protein-L-isoaspartate O-methyltransferase [Rhizobacter sp.]